MSASITWIITFVILMFGIVMAMKYHYPWLAFFLILVLGSIKIKD